MISSLCYNLIQSFAWATYTMEAYGFRNFLLDWNSSPFGIAVPLVCAARILQSGIHHDYYLACGWHARLICADIFPREWFSAFAPINIPWYPATARRGWFIPTCRQGESCVFQSCLLPDFSRDAEHVFFNLEHTRSILHWYLLLDHTPPCKLHLSITTSSSCFVLRRQKSRCQMVFTIICKI